MILHSLLKIVAVLQDFTNENWSAFLFFEYAKRAIYMTQISFVISGCLSCYFFLPMIEKSSKQMSFLSFAFKRWIRTAPTTLAVIISMFALSTMYRGPIAHELLDQHIGNCRRGWWLTVSQRYAMIRFHCLINFMAASKHKQLPTAQ